MKKLLSIVTVLVLLTFSFNFVFAKEKCLVMGLIPAEDPKAMIEKYTPLKNFLEKEIGRCIELFTATDYTGVIEAMRAKKVDFAWFGPFSYVLAHERAGAEAFAVGVDKNGKTTYHSYLIATPEVAQKLGITKTLEGLDGLKYISEKLNGEFRRKFTFTFTETASTSGYAVPRYYMHLAGITPEKVFRKVGYVGTHDAAILTVKNKIIDMASVYDEVYHDMLDKGRITSDSVVIIWKSPEIVGEPFAYRGDLDEQTKRLLRNAITKVPSHLTGSPRLRGYKLTSDSEYKTIKEIKRFIDTLK
ncbi:MAG: phosphate/phosphite/phosphonate ABC transporter substrate-binding protein [Caldimicrobium sp.]|nr:phosphate/phosphite/phosphonate ABC transporter substrate-binding protein [Caldimicrobium sp.]MCX7874247.1 phosphate/phosphite/phosphonate ABC transporter substrate-binding protein [Caldimicrobium sp.]MDW8094776.1 phosphate/phosphite/phosphonate ABC transporter substrate-binding protein [Caldimicrobium sp.]